MKSKTVRISLALVLAAAAAFASGSWDSGWTEPRIIVGSGRSATESRAVQPFRGISLEGPGEVLLAVGSPPSVSVSADDNLLGLVMTEVRAGTLHLGFAAGNARAHRCAPRLPGHGCLPRRGSTPALGGGSTPALEELAIAGSGDIVARDTIRADRLAVSIGGSGSIRAEIDAGEVTARINGSGNIELSGRARAQVIRINGSGDYRARDLECAKAEVGVDGSGSTMLFVRRELAVSIHGSGDVRFRGGARVTVEDFGSGTVRAE